MYLYVCVSSSCPCLLVSVCIYVMKRRLRSHCTSGRLLCRRCSLTRPLLLVLFTVLTTLWCAAVASRAALTRFDAVSWSPTQIVASLTSSTPSETTREPLPVYGGVVNTSLQGIYCVDVENQVVYTGADVLHVFEIKSLSGSMVITESAGATVTESYDGGDTTTYTPAYYFEQVNEIYLTGWATACIFANRYELFISTTTVAPDETSRRGAAPPGSTTARKTSTMNHGHYYTVIHRYLRKALRTFASDAPPLEPASASTAKNLLSGASLVLRTGAVDGFSTRVVTPFWDGTICFEEVQTPFSAAQYWTLGPSSFPQSLVQPAEGQQSGNSTLYALAFTKPSLAASSSTSPWPAVYAWDIVGITLPEVHRDVADVPIAPASVSERFARCYASLIAAQCVDCLPVAFAASKRGIFLALTSRERNATYVTLLASGTDCTTEQQQQQQATTPTSAGESRGDNQQEVVLLQILTGVCNVAAMVVDDYALSHLYVAVECGQHRNSEKGQAQRYLVRVNMSTVDGDSSATTQVVPVQQPSPLPTTFTDDGTEEIMSLSLSNETRFLYLVVRRADATVRVYTYAAFGLSTLLPRAVDVAGGLSVRALGFGLTPGMQCVFNGSADAVIVANFSNSTALVCAAPSLSAALCTLHPISLRLPYTQPWAVPSALPLHAVVSPAAAPLAYVATPVVEKAINEKTGRNSATANTNVAVIVTGHNFVNGSVYGLDSTCYFWSLINQGRPNITAPATYINATALRCEFHDMKMIGCRTFVSVSIDGTVVSPTSAAFSVQGVATQVRVQVGVQNNSGQTSDISHASAQEPATHTTICLQSSAQVALPDIEAVLADAVRNAVDLPDLLSPLYAVLSFNDTWLMNGGGVVPLNNTVKADSTAASVASVEGDIVQPFAADGRASFVGITLKCPPIGKFTYYVYVSNGTDKLLDYHRGSVRIEVREGAPYAPVFVGQPSTWYYPDASLLLQQPVVGVRDACGNVYSFLNDSVLVGSLTVQLYKEVVLQRSKGNAEVVRREPYGAAWEVSTPLNNLFYLSNISFPAIDFSTQFYLNVTCDLPQPTIRSPPIIVMPCEADRVSRIVTTAEFGSEGQLLLPLHSRIVCDACPAHGICDGTSNVRAKDGYWRHNASTTQFTSCRFAFGMAEACVNDGQCAAGYHGVLCGECDLGYHTLGRACRKCLPRGLQGFLVFLVVFGMVLIMTTFVVLMALVPPSTLSGLSIRSLLLAVQVTSLFILIAVPWPHQLETLFNGLYALAEVLETMVRCFTSPQSYFIFIACSPLVLVSLVMVLAGVCLRVMRLHRVDAYRLSAVVLTALLHRKQERFHQLRHTIAQEIAEQGRAAMRRRRSTMNNNAFAERAAATAGESYSATASATRPSLSTEWELLERNAAASISRRVTHAASTALMDSFTATVPTIALAATAPRVERCMESVIIDAFAEHTAAVMEHMAAAAPASTWEQLVVKAMREGNAGLLSCVRGMHLPLPTRQQVQQWAEYTTEVVVGAGRKRSPEAPSRAEESVSPSSRSAGMRRAAGSSIRRQALNAAASSAAEGVFPYADSNDVNDGAAEASSVNSERAREAMPISWKRVGMIAAYREMAVHQFRASWVALLNSSVSIVMAYYYLPLILEAFLWLQCVTFEMRSNQYRSEITIPMRGATVRCDSAEYQVMRRLAIAMLVVYGFCYPLGHIVVSLILQRRYGVDVTYASLPVIFFGDSTFDYLISIGYLLTKLIAVIAVTQAASPMLQMGVLATLFALTIFLNSMWSISGQSVMLKSKYLTVTLRSVLTASRVVFLMVCHVLLLLIYLIVSGFDLSASGERGFVAIVSLGIGLVFAMFTAVSLHQIIMHLRHAWNYSDTVAKRDHEGQLLLEALVRRYLDMDRTIELYLQVCERGLAAAQRLDTLSSYRHLPHNGHAVDAAIAADDNLPSFSSFSGDGDQSGANSTNSSSLEGEPNRASATQSTNTSAAAAEEDEEGPEALTRFSPYPALTPKELPALSPTPPSATTTSRATARKTATTTAKASSKAPPRRTATYLSAAFRASSARSAASAESFSAASSSQQQQQKKCVGDPTAPLSALPRDVNYPAEAEFVTPVEGNPNWVSAPSQGVTGLVKAGDDAGPPTPNNGDKTSGDGRAAAAQANTGAGTPLSLSDYAATAAGTAAGAASTKPSAGGAHAEDASDAIPAPTLLKASPDTFSGDFAEVQTPISQPPLKRSNSLLLSIRCLDPNYAAQAQTTRDELVEESRAVATAEYEKERKQSQQLSGARADRNKSTAVANKSSGSVDGAVSRVSGNEAKQPPQQRSANAPEAVVTIESLVPAVELDLATSFDPLAVPPLPLTRALSRLRPIQSSPLVAGSTAITATRESRRSLLADLQSDLESELRQIQAMPLRDSLLDVDLGQLASTPSLLHNVHPISFWAGTTALEPLGSASPLSGASKSRVNHTATGRGGAAQASGTTLFSSKSFPDENTNEAASASPLQRPGPDTRTHSGNPLLNADIATAAAAAPSTGSAASLKRKDAPMPRPGLASGDRSDDVPADSDAATSPPAVPPLPRFEAPRIHTHTSHRTVVEYMRRRAARACRAQRSRYGKQNVQRSRTPKAGVDIPRIPQDSKSLNSTDTKPRSE